MSRVWWIALVLAATWPTAAAAQDDRRVDAAGGYASMRDYSGDVGFPRGWFGAVAVNVARPVAIVGETSGSYKSARGPDVRVFLRIHTAMGGPRVAWRGSTRFTPYAQLLVGVIRIATTYQLPRQTLSVAQHYFTIAPGGGVDIPFSRHAAVRVGGTVRLIRIDSALTGTPTSTYRQLQLIAGVAVR